MADRKRNQDRPDLVSGNITGDGTTTSKGRKAPTFDATRGAGRTPESGSGVTDQGFLGDDRHGAINSGGSKRVGQAGNVDDEGSDTDGRDSPDINRERDLGL